MPIPDQCDIQLADCRRSDRCINTMFCFAACNHSMIDFVNTDVMRDYDMLADMLRQHLDMTEIYRILNKSHAV